MDGGHGHGRHGLWSVAMAVAMFMVKVTITAMATAVNMAMAMLVGHGLGHAHGVLLGECWTILINHEERLMPKFNTKFLFSRHRPAHRRLVWRMALLGWREGWADLTVAVRGEAASHDGPWPCGALASHRGGAARATPPRGGRGRGGVGEVRGRGGGR